MCRMPSPTAPSANVISADVVRVWQGGERVFDPLTERLLRVCGGELFIQQLRQLDVRFLVTYC